MTVHILTKGQRPWRLPTLLTLTCQSTARQAALTMLACTAPARACMSAYTANDTIEVIDCATDCYLHALPHLMGVAGALVSEERNLVFTSTRGEHTVGIFAPDADRDKIYAFLPQTHRAAVYVDTGA